MKHVEIQSRNCCALREIKHIAVARDSMDFWQNDEYSLSKLSRFASTEEQQRHASQRMESTRLTRAAVIPLASHLTFSLIYRQTKVRMLQCRSSEPGVCSSLPSSRLHSQLNVWGRADGSPLHQRTVTHCHV